MDPVHEPIDDTPERIARLSLPLTAESYDLRLSTGYLLRRCSKLSQGLAEHAFAKGDHLSFSQFISLMLMQEGVAQTPGDLSRWLGMHSGAATRLIDQLHDRQLVTRTRCGRDRRSIKVHLTDHGVATAKALLPQLIDVWNGTLADFTSADFRQLLTLLVKLEGALSRAARGPGDAPSRVSLEDVCG